MYGSLLQGACEPEALEDGVAFSLALEPLSRAFLSGAAPDRARPLLRAELRALELLDIPLFRVDSSGTALHASDGLVAADYFTRSGHREVRRQVALLDAADRDLQAAIITGALDALAARSASALHLPATPERPTPLSDDELLQEALRIGEELAERALTDVRGGMTWLGFSYVPEADRFQHQVLGTWMYDGAPGVALFLAALFKETGQARFADLARRALSGVRALASAAPPPEPRPPQDLGGALGAGSALYALCETAALLSDESLLGDALLLAESITPSAVAADRRLDVMSGVAGTILGLASLHRATGSAHAVELATLCGLRLLETQADGAWPTMGSVPLAGMSHGAAGIAYALMRLQALTGQAAFQEAALRGIEYERAQFRESGGRWPDLRPGPSEDDGDVGLAQWCHGAAGIGLARVGCARLMPSREFEQEIDEALELVDRFGFGEIDHLCCGNMGRIETLIAGATHRDSAELRAKARSGASELVNRARRGGGYRLFGNLDRSVWSPGLFQGTAGIGYELLRLRNGSLRSFALWE